MELRVKHRQAPPPPGRAPDPRRRGEHGLTLTELLVVIAILAVIGGSLAGAFGIGLRLLAPTGAQATLTGNADSLAFEQQIGADIARAHCLAAPSMQAVPTGGCQRSVQNSPSSCAPSGYSLCLAWYVPGSSCHTVTYWQQSDGTVLRSDLSTSNNTTRIATGGLKIAATWTPAPTSNGDYQWTKQVTITITQRAIPGAPAPAQPTPTTFRLVPLAADPLSAALPGGASPC
ncbi:MAG: prepilin-type N-terminal cleavage/methylation domain-containing protein [Candidatus Dormibacter sp.]